MNTQTKLQVCAGLGAVISLPIIYTGLNAQGSVLPWIGIVLFGISMMVTPVLRMLPTSLDGSDDDV